MISLATFYKKNGSESMKKGRPGMNQSSHLIFQTVLLAMQINMRLFLEE